MSSVPAQSLAEAIAGAMAAAYVTDGRIKFSLAPVNDPATAISAYYAFRIFGCDSTGYICPAMSLLIEDEKLLTGGWRYYMADSELQNLTAYAEAYDASNSLAARYRYEAGDNIVFRLHRSANAAFNHNVASRLIYAEYYLQQALPITLNLGATSYNIYFMSQSHCTHGTRTYDGNYNPVYFVMRSAYIYTFIPTHQMLVRVLTPSTSADVCVYGELGTHFEYLYNPERRALALRLKPAYFQKMCTETSCQSDSTYGDMVLSELTAYILIGGEYEVYWSMQIHPAILFDGNMVEQLVNSGMYILFKLPTINTHIAGYIL